MEATLRTVSYHYYTGTHRIHLRLSWHGRSKRQRFWVDGTLSIDPKHQRHQWRAERLSNNLAAYLEELKMKPYGEEVELRLDNATNVGDTNRDGL